VNLSLNCNLYANINLQPATNTSNRTSKRTSDVPLKDRLGLCKFRIAVKSPPSICYESPVQEPRTKDCKTLDQNHYLCRSYLADPHCMKCNSFDYTDTIAKIQYCDKIPCSLYNNCKTFVSKTDAPSLPWENYRWSFLLTFSGDVASVAESGGSTKVTCHKNSVYDIVLSKCVEFSSTIKQLV